MITSALGMMTFRRMRKSSSLPPSLRTRPPLFGCRATEPGSATPREIVCLVAQISHVLKAADASTSLMNPHAGIIAPIIGHIVTPSGGRPGTEAREVADQAAEARRLGS